MFDSAGLRALRRHECVELLRGAAIGRIVYTDSAMPAIQPVHFIVHRDVIMIRTDTGGKLAAAARNAVVAFEVDAFTADFGSGWSVVVLGHAREVTDNSELAEVRALDLRLWSSVRLDNYIKIEMEIVTGRELAGPPSHTSLEQVVTPKSGGASATLSTHWAMSRGNPEPTR